MYDNDANLLRSNCIWLYGPGSIIFTGNNDLLIGDYMSKQDTIELFQSIASLQRAQRAAIESGELTLGVSLTDRLLALYSCINAQEVLNQLNQEVSNNEQ